MIPFADRDARKNMVAKHSFSPVVHVAIFAMSGPERLGKTRSQPQLGVGVVGIFLLPLSSSHLPQETMG